MNKSALGMLWLPMWITDEPTHLLEGRKREKWVGELRNVAHCKRGLTSWRGGRGRNGLVSSEMWHIAKRGLTCRRGGRGRSGLVSSEMWHVANEDSLEGRKREERVGELRNVACCKRGLTDRRGRRGRSLFVNLETWQVTEGSLAGGQETEERVGELRNVAHCKQGLTC